MEALIVGNICWMLDAAVRGWSRRDTDTVLTGWSRSTVDFCMVHQQQADRSTEVGFPHGLFVVLCTIVSIIRLHCSTLSGIMQYIE